MSVLPQVIEDEQMLDALLSLPSPPLVDMMRRLDGDVMVLGIGGKMGVSLGIAAARAIEEAGGRKRVFGVSRFSDPRAHAELVQHGVRAIPCDLLDRHAVEQLPKVRNVIYMVGRKFGTGGSEDLTWATNVIVPSHVGHHFHDSRIVVFSTGCVYPLVPVSTGGCTEVTPPDPVGEYAQSCLGRERVFGYLSRSRGTQMCFLRLNYAADLRYGVLFDIGRCVFESQPVDLTASHFNVIWQGDANRQALLALEYCTSPPAVLNVTGPETASVRVVAEIFARYFGTDLRFTGDDANSRMYLSNSGQATEHFGYPSVPLMTLIRWQADWIRRGQRSLNKPTHFGVVNGQF